MFNKNSFLPILLTLLIFAGGAYLYRSNLGDVQDKEVATNPGVTRERVERPYTNKDGEKWGPLPEGDQVYSIAGSQELYPRFIKAEIDPLKVFPGETQYMKVVLESKNPLKSVIAHVETDTGIREIEMTQVDESKVTREILEDRKYLVNKDNQLVINDKSSSQKIVESVIDSLVNRAIAQETKQYTYEADWVVEDTHITRYVTKFVAEDTEGHINSHNMAWSDPWIGLREFDGSGTDYIGNNGTIQTGELRYLERGNVGFSGSYQVTINDGGVFAWNPGYSINLGNGSFSIADGGEMTKDYIYLPDDDQDQAGTRNPSFYSDFTCPDGSNGDTTVDALGTCDIKVKCPADNPDCGETGPHRRAGYMNNDYDCADQDSNVHSGQTSYFTSQGSNGWDYNCSGSVERNWPSVVSSCNQLREYESIPIAQWVSDLISKASASSHTYYGWIGSEPSCGQRGIFNQSSSQCGQTQSYVQSCR